MPAARPLTKWLSAVVPQLPLLVGVPLVLLLFTPCACLLSNFVVALQFLTEGAAVGLLVAGDATLSDLSLSMAEVEESVPTFARNEQERASSFFLTGGLVATHSEGLGRDAGARFVSRL